MKEKSNVRVRITILLAILIGFGGVKQVSADENQIRHYEVLGDKWVGKITGEVHADLDKLYVNIGSDYREVSFYYPDRGNYVIKINDYVSYGGDGNPAEVYLDGFLQEQDRYYGYIEKFEETGRIHVKFGVYTDDNRSKSDIFVYAGDQNVRELIDTEGTILNGTYSGTGTASVETAFGTFNLGALPKTKINAIVSSEKLELDFQAKGQPYSVSAKRIAVDENGVSTYSYSDENEQWAITIEPEGTLTGTLILSGDRGKLDFNMVLTPK